MFASFRSPVGQFQRTFVSWPSRVPRVFWIAFLGLIGFTLATSAVTVAMQREIVDPFTNVPALLGQATSQLIQSGRFTCGGARVNTSVLEVPMSCVTGLDSKIVAGLTLLTADDVVDEINLTLAANTQTLGDLVSLWDRPSLRQYCDTVVAYWPAQHIVASVKPATAGQVEFAAPVNLVSFTREGTPSWEAYMSTDALHFCGGVKVVALKP